jgi:hypothetical protein
MRELITQWLEGDKAFLAWVSEGAVPPAPSGFELMTSESGERPAAHPAWAPWVSGAHHAVTPFVAPNVLIAVAGVSGDEMAAQLEVSFRDIGLVMVRLPNPLNVLPMTLLMANRTGETSDRGLLVGGAMGVKDGVAQAFLTLARP